MTRGPARYKPLPARCPPRRSLASQPEMTETRPLAGSSSEARSSTSSQPMSPPSYASSEAEAGSTTVLRDASPSLTERVNDTAFSSLPALESEFVAEDDVAAANAAATAGTCATGNATGSADASATDTTADVPAATNASATANATTANTGAVEAAIPLLTRRTQTFTTDASPPAYAPRSSGANQISTQTSSSTNNTGHQLKKKETRNTIFTKLACLTVLQVILLFMTPLTADDVTILANAFLFFVVAYGIDNMVTDTVGREPLLLFLARLMLCFLYTMATWFLLVHAHGAPWAHESHGLASVNAMGTDVPGPAQSVVGVKTAPGFNQSFGLNSTVNSTVRVGVSSAGGDELKQP